MEVVFAGKSRVRFDLLGFKSYVRRDGAETAVKVWQAHCRTCGAAFQVITSCGVTSADQANVFKLRRCKKHRKRLRARRGEIRSAV